MELVWQYHVYTQHGLLHCSVQNASQEIIQHVKEQNQLEKETALDLIELRGKREKLRLVRRYMSHYLLGLKVCWRCNGLSLIRTYS